ncbi:hypothetical protein KKI90_09145 [Xenorhabdus bovienii]|uniref:hypothetical protein n=1 Tax=Xenorhabdus bovienii TaxID=40576 RepID=UPI00237D00EA|nr:hypothetical protein [Xenorhabdus bovienii]MDE1486419.1 hypothetical protein [Xenorhabdus bovienii]MDE1497063.1 hypothetical protein [Xenorhabdus bovienii]MDE9477264.1 hypothetical protein [Xenorhabdus bovienii]MDE9530557.1 hypothetical protein [Xenorhabdus bovienii]
MVNKLNNKINKLSHHILHHEFEKASDILYFAELDEKNNIMDVIENFIKCGKNAIFEFFMYLHVVERKNLVRKFFPEVFTKLLSNQEVRIKNKYYNSLQLKLGTASDSGDHLAYGSDPTFSSSLPYPDRFLWVLKFELESDGENYFRIVNKYYNSLQLKLGTDSDSGDHLAYGSDPTFSFSLPYPDRFLWKLVLDSNDEDNNGASRVYFRIVNKYYDSLQLKLGTASDSGDHLTYGSDPTFSSSLPYPDRFLWSIE